MKNPLLDYMRGTMHFFKLLRDGRLKELDRMVEAGKLCGVFQVTKFENDQALLLNEPYLIGDPFHNQLVNVGLTAVWNLVTNQNAVTAFSNANANIGVGDSTAAFALTQTDLQAASNKLRVAMDASFPNTPVLGVEQWRSTFTSAQANYAWQEFAIFNANAAGTMLNRALSVQGTKTSGQSWQILYQITLS